jgi:pseudaminic acid synthase
MIIDLGKTKIGDEQPVFIIAEISANHCGDYDIARQTIKAAAEAGAHAVKLQTYTADTLTINVDNPYFRINGGTPWDGNTLYELYQKAHTPWEWQPELKKISEDLGLIFFSSPFDNSAVDFLESLNVLLYKIASFEMEDTPLIEYTASKGKPMIMSTGIATGDIINDAIQACKKVNNDKIILLKCTSAYPSKISEANLLTIPDMIKRFNTIVGISDHSLGLQIPAAAVALGAKVIEKHFILDRKLGGPDASFSLSPREFEKMVEIVGDIEKSLGIVDYQPQKNKTTIFFSRSLFVVSDIKKGEIFTEHHIRSIRPGFGLSPKFYNKILGKKAKKTLTKGTPLESSQIEDFEL